MGKDSNQLMQRIITAITKGRNIGFALSVMVVFVATYLLILPAMTLEQDEAERQGGIDIATEQAVTEQEDPAAPAAGSLSCEGEGYSVSAEYGAKAGLPLGTELTVEEITEADADYAAFCDEALKALQETKGGEQIADLKFAKFYDITLAADGNELEPDAPVDVTISYDKGPKVSDADSVRVVHFGTDKKGQPQVEVLKPGETDAQINKKGRMTETSFRAESFSVYAVVYTVDFQYEVDGETFEYSLPGGGFISFTGLVDALGISADNADFVEGVEKIEFSNPKLVDVSQVDAETTVGKIKESRGLNCEYSADLTGAQIEEINAQTVRAGDWALISLLPFDTEESLTVTMKTGEVFQITVTDDQQNPFGLDGKSFAITAYKKSNNTYYYITSDGTGISSSNPNCLKAYTFNPSSGGTPQGSAWTFEWTGEGKKYLIHDAQNRYIVIENDKVSLTDKDTALANPITVVSREGKYSFVNEKNNHALNIFGSPGFGSWTYDASNSDFLMTLQNPSNMKTPGTIATADTSSLLQINLFDYGPENELDKEANNNSRPYSGGINSGHTLKFFSYGKNVGTGINDFTGAGNGPQMGIVADQLVRNYPVVASNPTESLDYLFGGATNTYVTPYANCNHLFTLDENGYYHYNSDQNYAYLNGSDFEVYSKTFPEEGADEQYFGVGFFPFNPYNEYYNCIHGKDGFGGWNPHSGGTDKNGHYNHHFGMSLAGNFIMPPGGQYNGNDVTFQFSGDDDMWVYVDGVLIMDIGGIHNPVHGEINFTTGEVTVHGAAQENFKEKYKRITGKDWDDSDFSNHDFRVFYMERGGMYSNLQVTFNLPLTPETKTANFNFDKVSSENESLKLSGAEFSLFTDSACEEPFTLATVPVKATSGDDGVVSFTNIPHGTYYMKETVYPTGYQAKTPEEIFKVVVGASGTTITKASGESVTKVTNQPRKIDVEVEKVWTDGVTVPGANVEIVLGRYELVEDPNAQGKGTLVIKDSYAGLPSGAAYHVTYTITGSDNYSKTITRSYTDTNKEITETVEDVPAGAEYTVTKQVQAIAHYEVVNAAGTQTVTVPKNGSVDAQFAQSTFNRNAYRVRIYAVDNQDQSKLSPYSEAYYPRRSALSIHIEKNQPWTWSNGYRFSVASNTGWSSGQFSSDGSAEFTSNLSQDIDLYVKCDNNSDWNKEYSWLKTPYITGANPVRAASADRMMMSMRRGAPAQTTTQTASEPTLPAPPKDLIYQVDSEYAANPDKITLSGGTWTGKAENLAADNENGAYIYYIAQVNETGLPDGTEMTISDEISREGALQVLTVTNTVPTGYLRIDKSVTFNGEAVPENKRSDLAGTYTFKVYTDENCSVPYKVKQGQTETDLTLTVTIGSDGIARTSETVKLPVGDYWIEEQTPTQEGVTPDENRIHVPVTKDSTTASPATADFVNNKDESDNPDEKAIELEKIFTGITSASQIPADFHVTLSYKVPGSNTPVTVTLNSSTQGHVTCTKLNNDLLWHWRITHIPANATDFSVSESNYDVNGYTRITKINNKVVADPSSPEGITLLEPEITMVNFWNDYTTSDKKKIFPVTGDQILLVRSTTGVTIVVSRKSLSMATRTAIEKLIINNRGKIPGNPDANATWDTTFVYFSHEIQGDSFSYGGRTIKFNGDNVEIPHNASSHEVRVEINYTSETAQNSFVLENSYEDIPIEVDLLKVEKGKETSTHLPDAVFELRKLKDIAPTSGGTLDYVTNNNNGIIVTSKPTGNNGRLTFDGLTNGIYEIREKNPPAGYVLSEEVVFYLKVEAGMISYVEKSTGKPSTWPAAPDDNGTIKFTAAQAATQDTAAVNALFRISNTPGAELPSSGGPGTTWIYLLGTILLLGSAILLAARRRASRP